MRGGGGQLAEERAEVKRARPGEVDEAEGEKADGTGHIFLRSVSARPLILPRDTLDPRGAAAHYSSSLTPPSSFWPLFFFLTFVPQPATYTPIFSGSLERLPRDRITRYRKPAGRDPPLRLYVSPSLLELAMIVRYHHPLGWV